MIRRRYVIRAAFLAGLLLGGLLPAPGARAADMSGSFSVILYDPATGEIGIGVLSHAAACGSFVPWVEAGVGAIATQGETNPAWGPRGLDLLRAGVPVAKVVDSLYKSDDGFQRRQLGALDRTGWPAGYSGIELVNWSGGVLDSNFAMQGNTMTNHVVMDVLADTVRATRGQPLADRLLLALTLGERLKADWRGARSAAILVGRLNPERPADRGSYISVRVDDSPRPIAMLAAQYRSYRAGRLVAAHLDYAGWYRRSGDTARGALEEARARDDVQSALADTTLPAPALNAMAWQLAQRGAMLDQAWDAIERAQEAEPRSTEFTDTAAEVRLRQGRAADALALSKVALARVPRDQYLQSREKFFEAEAAKPAPPVATGKGKPKKKG
jgi:uncharacterized Ntn-hydrolase superfamily protein